MPEQQQKPNFLKKAFKQILAPSTKPQKTPTHTNPKLTSESMIPVATDRSILTSTDNYEDPTRLRFLAIMSKVSKDMDTAWRSWVSASADPKALQEFGRLAVHDTAYQHELHRLILDRFGTDPITVYHATQVGAKTFKDRVGFMTATTSRKVAEHYTKDYGDVDIEELIIQPEDIKAIGSISESEVVFIARQASPVL